MTKTEFLYATPVLSSLNIANSAQFCVDKLGFQIETQSENYLVAKREGIDIHYMLCNDPNIPQNTACYIWVKNINPLYEEIKPKGILYEKGELQDTPWGFRQFAVVDDDGNSINFGEVFEST